MTATDARLASYIERLERLDAEMKDLRESMKDIYTEVASAGYETKVVRKVLKLRAMGAAKWEAEASMVDAYMVAVGEYASTPLGQAGLSRAA